MSETALFITLSPVPTAAQPIPISVQVFEDQTYLFSIPDGALKYMTTQDYDVAWELIDHQVPLPALIPLYDTYSPEHPVGILVEMVDGKQVLYTVTNPLYPLAPTEDQEVPPEETADNRTDSVFQIAFRIFKTRSAAVLLTAIALAETQEFTVLQSQPVSTDPGSAAFSSGGFYKFGVWQLSLPHWKVQLQALTGSTSPTAWAQYLESIEHSAILAKQALDSEGLHVWPTYVNGDYKQYLPQVNEAMKRVRYVVVPLDIGGKHGTGFSAGGGKSVAFPGYKYPGPYKGPATVPQKGF
jgi:hypothetical protein